MVSVQSIASAWLASIFGRGRDLVLPGFTPVGCTVLGDSNGQDRPFGTYSLGDNMTRTKGPHTFKFGDEFGDNYSNDFDNLSTRSAPNFTIFTNTGTSALTETTPFSNPTVEDAVWGLLGGVSTDLKPSIQYCQERESRVTSAVSANETSPASSRTSGN